MTRPLCRFAGPLIPNTDRLRQCSHPDVNRRVRKLVDCSTCPHWEQAQPKAKPVPSEPPAKPTRISLPCLHVGQPAPPPEGKSVVRSWHECEAGKGIVCPCMCGPKCDKYTPDTQE